MGSFSDTNKLGFRNVSIVMNPTDWFYINIWRINVSIVW